MRATIRAKLIAVVAMAALSILAVVSVSAVISGRVEQQLAAIRDQYLPQLELGPQLEAGFEALRRGLQDAVAANDMDALLATQELKSRFLERLASARGAIAPEVSMTLRSSVEGYYAQSFELSRRIIQGETGEVIVDAMARMQEKQARTLELLEKAIAFDRTKLGDAFTGAIEYQRTGTRVRVAIGLACLCAVSVFCLWVTRGTFHALGELTAGLARFGEGSFGRRIEIPTHDEELREVAEHANNMAANLRAVAEERERVDWSKSGLVQLSDVLRGTLGVGEAARRTVEFLVRRVEALAGALYLKEEGARFRLAAHFGLPPGNTEGSGPIESFRTNEGLVGRAAASAEIVVVRDLPDRYMRVRSALGEAEPRELVLVPITSHGKTAGILELAFFSSCSPIALEFLAAVREVVAITLEAASSRDALHELLEESRQLTEKLAAQEEELRANNEELLGQQEELRQAYDELEAHRHQLSEQNAELLEAKRGVQEKADELSRVSAYKSQFLANMSHELRTPLNSMLLLSQLLANNEGQNLTPKQVEHCKTVHSAGKDLLTLINQILDLAKIEAGRQELYLERVLVREFADHARRVFGPLAAERGLRLTAEVAGDVPEYVITDRHRVERILTNLVGNAIKFTEHGEVRLRIERPDGATRLQRNDLPRDRTIAFAVTDTGIGIPPEARERVFAPFEQLEARADRRYGGTGLGLAIARESAALLGGELRLDSEIGRGSTFTCYLPEACGPLDVEAGTTGLTSRAPAAPSRQVVDDRTTLSASRPHLLVIEDDPVFAEQLVDVIRSRKLQVLVATTGEDGLQLARRYRPQGIILDVRLPDLDGWAVMDRLKKEPETSSIPVHFISGVDTPERGFALGAVGYLAKPATRQELIGVVRTLAPESPDRTARILVVEDNAETGESVVHLLRGEKVEPSHVTSAETAIEALLQQRFDCMILDLGLPDMDGLGLLETLKSRQDVRTPPVVVYTARALTRDETRRIEAYADAVVLKEGNSEERLREEIRLFVGHVKSALPETDRPVPSQPRGSDVSLRNRRILLADDDMRTVYAVSALLRGKGADVIVADTGREALELLVRTPEVDGVLMDVMMPEMDGYEAMRQLRRERRFESLPVIALTAKAMKGERERCLEAGASDYLAKPVDGDQLLTMLDTWLKRDGRKQP